jgi:hypothetical protein
MQFQIMCMNQVRQVLLMCNRRETEQSLAPDEGRRAGKSDGEIQVLLRPPSLAGEAGR